MSPARAIPDPQLAASWRYWWSFLRISWRVRCSLREAIYSVNHGVASNGEHYRACSKLRWLERRPDPCIGESRRKWP